MKKMQKGSSESFSKVTHLNTSLVLQHSKELCWFKFSVSCAMKTHRIPILPNQTLTMRGGISNRKICSFHSAAHLRVMTHSSALRLLPSARALCGCDIALTAAYFHNIL